MILIFLFTLGLSVGSFLNVLIDRLPQGQSITGRSHCDHCRRRLSWFDLIPVVSFFILNGQCRYCKKKISWQYPLVEMLTGLTFILIFNLQFSRLPKPMIIGGQAIFNEFSINWLFNNWNLIVNWILKIGILSCLIVIFFSDLKYHIIPDSIQVAFFIFTFIYHYFIGIFEYSKFYILNSTFLLSGLLIMFPILFLYLITRGRGMGFGDVKLAFNIGFLLGWQGGFLALYFAFISGALVGLILIFLRKTKLKSKIAFGPFLVIGILIMLFWQREILDIVAKIYRL